MDTALVTFMVQTLSSTHSVHLIGSWDNFTKRYYMERDPRKARGQWRGCHRFKDITCDGESFCGPKRTGGLKMGSRYYYYYELDGSVEYYNEKMPYTTSCPYLPGQPVNYLWVPLEIPRLRKRSASMSSVRSEDLKTIDPTDKYIELRIQPVSSTIPRSNTSTSVLLDQKLDRTRSPQPRLSPRLSLYSRTVKSADAKFHDKKRVPITSRKKKFFSINDSSVSDTPNESKFKFNTLLRENSLHYSLKNYNSLSSTSRAVQESTCPSRSTLKENKDKSSGLGRIIPRKLSTRQRLSTPHSLLSSDLRTSLRSSPSSVASNSTEPDSPMSFKSRSPRKFIPENDVAFSASYVNFDSLNYLSGTQTNGETLPDSSVFSLVQSEKSAKDSNSYWLPDVNLGPDSILSKNISWTINYPVDGIGFDIVNVSDQDRVDLDCFSTFDSLRTEMGYLSDLIFIQ
ncbi:hypothetical protein GcM3_217008 [Golovinomyces cichoracearum]|uniref:Uncharacterized protein n=1 Tax=Golovinomyces cichoracearum TaxID=62708 RepID=A0A420H850_9PEZI|nr:hypothetical protein GcM3_217008 [Golovinomyces cichoracearum]